jgi:hypothetical protein
VSPSKFESQATNSPSKLSVPNRKQRNQPSNRVHDIEFATEISTSLLSRIRDLQSLLAEKEEALRSVTSEKSRLEAEAEGFHQRLRSLDESEHRYKDENWNLQIQIHEHIASAKEAADREKKLSQTLNVIQSEKNIAQKELDEIKLTHSRLVEEHAQAVKHYDVELGGAKRNLTMVENDRYALQRKIEDLTSQNQELAVAVAQSRARADEQEAARGIEDEDFETANDNITPEHSPPPSPMKGTPRHSMLESETLKSSLHHAHRMIQSLKGNIHREKTEKLELKRLLQDARDELETRRADSIGGSAKRSRKADSKEFKKPFKPGQLGGLRTSRSEILDDNQWEDNDGQASPSRHGPRSFSAILPGTFPTTSESSDHFETANEAEASDAFETANERGTETDDFHTGNEGYSDSEELTETEGGASGTIRVKKPPPLSLTTPGNRRSFESTASTSADEYSYEDVKTPVQTQHQRLRLRMGRGARRSRTESEEHQLDSSPASFANSSNNGTPQASGQTLFAELGELNGSDEEESFVEGTPSRIGATPGSTPAAVEKAIETNDSPITPVPVFIKPIMVNSGMMTDDWEPTPQSAIPLIIGAGLAGAGIDEVARELHEDAADPQKRPMSDAASQWQDEELDRLGVMSNRNSRPISTSTYSDMSSQYDTDMDEKLANFPVPPVSPGQNPMPSITAVAAAEIPLSMSTIQTEHVEPIEPALEVAKEPEAVPLSLSAIQAEHVEPVQPLEVEDSSEPNAVLLSVSAIQVEHVEPIHQVEVEVAKEPEVVPATPLKMSLSSIEAIETQPISPAKMEFSTIETVETQPLSPVPVSPVKMGFSSIDAVETEPVEVRPATPMKMAISSIGSVTTEPIEARPVTPVTLDFSSVQSVDVEPIEPSTPIRDVRREAVILPRASIDQSTAKSVDVEVEQPETPKPTFLTNVLRWGKDKTPVTPFIAEDETRQSPNQSPAVETPESQRPFKEMSVNTNERAPRKPEVELADESSQTSLTSEQIDSMLKDKVRRQHAILSEDSQPATSPVRGAVPFPIRTRKSEESIGSVKNARSKMSEPDFEYEVNPLKRPDSASSNRGSAMTSHPPLPPNHQQAIAAAARRIGSSEGGVGTMGPPLLPASAYKSNPTFRPRTPSSAGPGSPASRNGTTPRVKHTAADPYQSLSVRSRASSVTSFASEVDNRFNLRNGGVLPQVEGSTDPRMIQAITQTMIGEYLWKYTRKPGRSETSDNRHRRYFWVHPYTRTLYWSDRDPSQAGRSEHKAKSVSIDAVRVVTDDNPMPPGLHRKSLIIVAPGRSIKFTAQTGQRHETWFNALSYLLLKTDESMVDTEDMTGGLTREDVDEFNPGYRSRSTRGRGAPSLSSYNSRTTNNESPARQAAHAALNPPTLIPTTSSRPSMGTFSRLSSYLIKPSHSESFSTRRSRQSIGHGSIYEASEVHDSAEDLREMYEKQDRESDRLENVRACCDGNYLLVQYDRVRD